MPLPLFASIPEHRYLSGASRALAEMAAGVVIIAYSNTLPAATITGGGTQTNVGGNFIYTFTSSGTITF